MSYLAPAGALTSTAGSLMSMFGAQNQANKIHKIYDKYQEILQGFSDKSLKQVLGSTTQFSMPRYTNALEQAANARKSQYGAVMAVPTGFAMMPKASTADYAKANLEAERRAALNAYGDVDTQLGLALSQNSQKLAGYNAISKLYLDDMQRELAKAGKANSLMTVGKLLSSVGSSMS